MEKKNMTANEYANAVNWPYPVANMFLKGLVAAGVLKLQKPEAPKEGEKGSRGRKADVYVIPEKLTVEMFDMNAITTKVRPSKEEREAAEKAAATAKAERIKVRAAERLAKAEKAAAEKIAKAKAAVEAANAEAVPA